jgi:hypothetical protein
MAGRRRGAAAGQRASGAAPLARYSCPAAAAAAATTCRPLGRLNSYLPRGAAWAERAGVAPGPYPNPYWGGGRHHVQAVGQAELVPATQRGRAGRAGVAPGP